ncbi:MAG: hypothetical protein NTU84_05870 [Verrucomicrobia bacterium]|nr:hypothetical protein [Verrucomicrobiota bacterium]
MADKNLPASSSALMMNVVCFSKKSSSALGWLAGTVRFGAGVIVVASTTGLLVGGATRLFVKKSNASRPPRIKVLMIMKIDGIRLRRPLRISLERLSFSQERSSLDRLLLRRFLILFGSFV